MAFLRKILLKYLIPITIYTFKLFANQENYLSKYAENKIYWQDITEGFRKKHHFSLLFPIQINYWDIEFSNFNIKSKAKSYSLDIIFSYNYHIQFYNGIGYFIGSSIGLKYNFVRDKNFNNLFAIKLPGITVGLIYDHNSYMQYYIMSGFYITRFIKINYYIEKEKISKNNYKNPSPMSITGNNIIFKFGINKFFDLKSAFSISIFYDMGFSTTPNLEDQNKHFPLNILIKKDSFGIEIGFLRHFF